MNKYRAKRTAVDGHMFASRAEALVYQDRLLMVRAGEIRDLVLQPRFRLLVNGDCVGTYVGDFQYIEVASGRIIVEDVKGVATPVYRLKKKLMLAVHRIEILETRIRRR